MTGNGPVVSAEAITAPAQYPPNGEIVVDDPNIEVGGRMVFRGSGCKPGETLSVLFDGAQTGTLPSDSQGNFAGSLSIPTGTPPGQHLLTVRGSACELNAVVNVLGSASRTRVHRLVEPYAHLRAVGRRRDHDRRRAPAGLASSAFGGGRYTVGMSARHAMSDVDIEHRIALLREVWLFSACNEEEIERIAAMAEPRSVDAGTAVTREGEEGLEFFVVVEGTAIASVEGDEIGRIAPGGFFGEMALIDGGERVATVTAVAPMRLLVLGRHEFNEMLEIAMPAVTPKLLAVVGARMRTIDRHAGVESTLGL